MSNAADATLADSKQSTLIACNAVFLVVVNSSVIAKFIFQWIAHKKLLLEDLFLSVALVCFPNLLKAIKGWP